MGLSSCLPRQALLIMPCSSCTAHHSFFIKSSSSSLPLQAFLITSLISCLPHHELLIMPSSFLAFLIMGLSSCLPHHVLLNIPSESCIPHQVFFFMSFSSYHVLSSYLPCQALLIMLAHHAFLIKPFSSYLPSNVLVIMPSKSCIPHHVFFFMSFS